MNTVSIYTSVEDAEKLALILLKAEVTFHTEMIKTEDERGWLFTVTNNEETEWPN